MSDRDIRLLLEDMQEAAQKICNYTEGLNFSSFLSDDKTIDAVIRNFEIIGEASARIGDDFKHLHPYIEWRRMTGLRNRIIHEYFGIDYEMLWKIVEENIPELIERLFTLLNDTDNPFS